MEDSADNIRIPYVAGTFYPSEKQELYQVLKQVFDNTKPINTLSKIKALIVPHAGFIYSAQTAAWGYRQLDKKNRSHFILIGPSHHEYFEGLVSSDKKFWQTPLGLIKQEKITSPDDSIAVLEKAHIPEHSLEVQFPFLQYRFDNFSASTLLTGSNIDYERTAKYLINNYPDSTLVISSDLSHFLPLKEAEKIDFLTIDAVLKNEDKYFSQKENIACGAEGIIILITMAKKNKWKCKLVKYDTSYTVSKDRNTVVGYASIIFYE